VLSATFVGDRMPPALPTLYGVQVIDPWWRRHRGPLTDLAFGLPLLAFAVAVVLRATDPQWWPAALTAVTALAMGLRRRAPAAVAAGVVVAVALGGAEFALAPALFTLAVRRRDRVLAVLAVAGCGTLVRIWVLSLQPGDPLSAVLGAGLMTSVLVVLPVLAGAYVGTRRQLIASLQERAERVEREQEMRMRDARRAERTRIAREMHDVLAHRISLVTLHAGGLEVNPASGPDDVERTAVLIGEHARVALHDLREVLGVLRADDDADEPDGAAAAEPQPTLCDVPRLVEASRAAGVRVRLADPLPADPPPLVGRTAYRVVQECLTNAHRHAPGATVAMRIQGVPGGHLVVELSNGRAVGSELAGRSGPGAGTGLVGLTERVQLAGGSLTSGPDGVGGFTVRAVLPWPAPTATAPEVLPT
jgi:signal transduction histidine kinase